MMDYAEFKRRLSTGDIFPVYLFSVEEPYLLRAAVRELLARLASSSQEVDYEPLFADETSYEEIVDKAADLPLFGGKRLVLVRNLEKLTTSPPAVFEDYLKNPSPSTVLAFSLERIGGKRRRKALSHPAVKLIANYGEVVELRRLKLAKAERFAHNYLRRRGYQAEPRAISLLIELVGADLYAIASELEKAMLYLGEERKLSLREAELIFGGIKKHQIWELSNAVGSKNAGRALLLLSRLMVEGIAPEVLLAAVEGHIVELSRFLEASLSGEGRAKLQSLIGDEGRRFLADEYLRQARNFDLKKLKRALSHFADFDFYLKRSVFKKREEVLLAALILELTSERETASFSPPIY